MEKYRKRCRTRHKNDHNLPKRPGLYLFSPGGEIPDLIDHLGPKKGDQITRDNDQYREHQDKNERFMPKFETHALPLLLRKKLEHDQNSDDRDSFGEDKHDPHRHDDLRSGRGVAA